MDHERDGNNRKKVNENQTTSKTVLILVLAGLAGLVIAFLVLLVLQNTGSDTSNTPDDSNTFPFWIIIFPALLPVIVSLGKKKNDNGSDSRVVIALVAVLAAFVLLGAGIFLFLR